MLNTVEVVHAIKSVHRSYHTTIMSCAMNVPLDLIDIVRNVYAPRLSIALFRTLDHPMSLPASARRGRCFIRAHARVDRSYECLNPLLPTIALVCNDPWSAVHVA
jgi:hypothetical protein